MKKLAILAIINAVFLTFSVSAQQLTTEQKMLPFAMSMALSVAGEMHDEQYMSVLTIFQKQMPHWSEALKPVVEMDKNTADYRRMDIALTATKTLRQRSNESDKWQMLVGEQFGTIYAMIKKNRTEDKEISADDLKFNLELISILANKTPGDIPANVAAKFKEFGRLKDVENLTADKNLSKIATEVVGILNTISK
jgi:putative lipoic acid-binding regulatory protein